jgi:hypothetical protein
MEKYGSNIIEELKNRLSELEHSGEKTAYVKEEIQDILLQIRRLESEAS